jgi:hypothetical protein
MLDQEGHVLAMLEVALDVLPATVVIVGVLLKFRSHAVFSALMKAAFLFGPGLDLCMMEHGILRFVVGRVDSRPPFCQQSRGWTTGSMGS